MNRPSIELLIETNKRVSIDNNNMYNNESQKPWKQ